MRVAIRMVRGTWIIQAISSLSTCLGCCSKGVNYRNDLSGGSGRVRQMERPEIIAIGVSEDTSSPVANPFPLAHLPHRSAQHLLDILADVRALFQELDRSTIRLVEEWPEERFQEVKARVEGVVWSETTVITQ